MELVTTRQSAYELKQVELRLQFLQTLLCNYIVHYPSDLPIDDVKAKPELAILF